VYKPAGQGWYNVVQLRHDIAWVDAEKSGGIPWGNVELGKKKYACFTHCSTLYPTVGTK